MKKLQILVKSLVALLIPIIAAVSVYLLTFFLPDSKHIIRIISYCFFFAETTVLCFLFQRKKIIRYLGRTSGLFCLISWIHLLYPVFFLYHITQAFTICLIIFYFIIAVTICIFSGKQKIHVYGWIFVPIIFSGFFHYLTLISLCYSPHLYSALLFAGATVFLALIFYYIIDLKKYHFRHSKVVSFILLICSQILLSAGSIVMIM